MWKWIGMLLVIGAAAGVAVRLLMGHREHELENWRGLTEEEAHAAIAERLGPKADTERGRAMVDKAVAKMRAKGLLAEPEPA